MRWRIDPCWLAVGLALTCLFVGVTMGLTIMMENLTDRAVQAGQDDCPPSYVWIRDSMRRSYCVWGHRVP